MSAIGVQYHPQILGGPSNIMRMCWLPRGNCPRTWRPCKTPNRVRIFPPHMPRLRTPTSHNTRQYCCTQNSANSPPAACASRRSPWPTRMCAYRMRDREWSSGTAASRSRTSMPRVFSISLTACRTSIDTGFIIEATSTLRVSARLFRIACDDTVSALFVFQRFTTHAIPMTLRHKNRSAAPPMVKPNWVFLLSMAPSKVGRPREMINLLEGKAPSMCRERKTRKHQKRNMADVLARVSVHVCMYVNACAVQHSTPMQSFVSCSFVLTLSRRQENRGALPCTVTW